MKKILVFLLLILTLTLVACDLKIVIDDNSGNSGENGDERVHAKNTVNFFTINDIHGQIITDDEAGTTGLDRVSTILKRLSANDDYIKVSAGDLFQGTFFSNSLYGRPAIEWLNRENFDCFIIGNHEFDWGIDKIAAYKDGNLENGELNEDCEVLGCNIYLKATNATPDWIDEYSIEECNGYKVGVIGCIGEGLTSSIAASMCKDYTFVDPVPIASKLAKKLRVEEKCDVVVVVIHDYNTGTQNDGFANLTGDSRIDAIICGHTHTQESEYLTRSDGYKIPVIECYGNNGSVGTIQINMRNDAPVSNGKISHFNPKKFDIDTDTYNFLYTFYDDVKKVGEQVIGYTSRNLSKEEVGNIANLAMMAKFNAEVGIVNAGGIRSAISAGNITYSDVYKSLPFDNTVMLLKMMGSDLKRVTNTSLYVSIDDIDDNKVYTVAVISYVYENYNGFAASSSDVENTNEIIRDVVMDYIRENYTK